VHIVILSSLVYSCKNIAIFPEVTENLAFLSNLFCRLKMLHIHKNYFLNRFSIPSSVRKLVTITISYWKLSRLYAVAVCEEHLQGSWRDASDLFVYSYLTAKQSSLYLKSSVFWHINTCSALKFSWRFGGTCCLQARNQHKTESWRYAPEDRPVHNHSCENFKACASIFGVCVQ
jgi:hypothetical protein